MIKILRHIPVILLIAITVPSLLCQEFSYEELTSTYKKEDIGSIKSRLLGTLSTLYEQPGIAAFNLTEYNTIEHCIKGVPSAQGPTSLSFHITLTINAYTKDLKISLIDKEHEITESIITTYINNKGTPQATGLIYMEVPESYIRIFKGRTLLHLSERIAYFLGAKKYQIVDASWDALIYHNFKETLSLALLGTYMYGKTYYQSQGYTTYLGYSDTTQYQEAQQLLHNLSWSSVYTDLPEEPQKEILIKQFPLQNYSTLSSVVKKLYQGARKGDENHFILLKWLYHNNLYHYAGNKIQSKEIQKAQLAIKLTHEFYKDLT